MGGPLVNGSGYSLARSRADNGTSRLNSPRLFAVVGSRRRRDDARRSIEPSRMKRKEKKKTPRAREKKKER